MTTTIAIERLLDGHPLISPTERRWEAGVAFNASAILLKPELGHRSAMRALVGPDAETRYPKGIVAMHYRARPATDPGFPWTRSFIGLALYTPDLDLIKRFSDPVISPGLFGDDVDALGCEDPRVTWIDGTFWIVYCGVRPVQGDPTRQWLGSVCVAKSDDLVHWEKLGAVPGTSDAFAASPLVPCDPATRVSNKDGVLFPDRTRDGKVLMLHRPMRGDIGTWTTQAAIADHVEGPYTDLGFVNGPERRDCYEESWVGAGSVPIPVGGGRYLGLAHTGNFLPGMRREYVLDAHLYDLNAFDPARPESLLVARIDGFMRPETDFEVHGPFPDSVANVLFCCGAWVHEGWLYWVYGGGDSYTMAARARLNELVAALEERRRR